MLMKGKKMNNNNLVKYSDNIQRILACPHCGGSLSKNNDNVSCIPCNIDFPYTNTGALDMRLKRSKIYNLEIKLGHSLFPSGKFDFNVLEENIASEVDFAGVAIPPHLSKTIMSYIPEAKNKNSLALDLGCGDTIHKNVIEHAGFEYVGLDYDNKEAPILGDAHSLPFKSDSFEFILSTSVLEHIQFPLVMMKEAFRVLKTGGKFIGSVSFLEPFHGDSFYHHTHLGTYNSLNYGGFGIEFISPNRTWSGLVAQAKMGNALFPGMPKNLRVLPVKPLLWLHKFWWRIRMGRSSENLRLRNNSGNFTFIAKKPI